MVGLRKGSFTVQKKRHKQRRERKQRRNAKLIKACKVKNGRQCASRCKAVWYMRYQYQASWRIPVQPLTSAKARRIKTMKFSTQHESRSVTTNILAIAATRRRVVHLVDARERYL